MKSFCERCNELVDYKEVVVDKRRTVKGRIINYIGKSAFCSKCDKELPVPDIREYNLKALDMAYRKEEGLISIQDIQKILKKYGIGKRPLSLLLGWGEGTLTRYVNGDTPTKPYSDLLIQILEDKEFYRELLEQNKDAITDLAYRKSLETLGDGFHEGDMEDKVEEENEAVKRLTISNGSKLESAAKYLLVETSEITPLALQKLLYFAQGFTKAFTKEYMFKEDCEAWAHGPVFREIYKKYKNCGYEPVDVKVLPLTDINLTQEEKELLDHIVLYFGCYSGKILKNMTHIEEPWRITRSKLINKISNNRTITKEEIGSYFNNVKEKYKMLNFADIKDYSDDLFNKINV